MEVSIDFGRIVKRLYKMLWLIVLVTAVTAAAGILYTWRAAPDIYTSRVTLAGAANGSYSNSLASTYIMRNYADLVRSEKIGRKVAQMLSQYQLDVFAVQAMVQPSYDKSENSAMFYIDALSTDPAMAVSVANAVAETFVAELKNVTGADNAIIIDEASTSTVSFSGQDNQIKRRLEIAAIGLVLSCVVISVVEIFSKRISQANDCTLDGTINLLGVIPKYSID